MDHSGSSATSTLIVTQVQRVLEEGGIATLATLMQGPANVGAKLLVEQSGETTGSLGADDLDEVVAGYSTAFLESREEAKTFLPGEFAPNAQSRDDIRVLLERIQPEPRLVICGAGHVGASLAKLAGFVGWETTLIDDRSDFVTRERFPDPHIELVAAVNWSTAVCEAIGNGRGVSVAIVTRGHNEDEECLRAVITTNPDYVGLIGSKRRTNIVLARLREAGTPENRLSRIRAPVGLDIAAVTPEEVALSILAEIIAERRGGKGGSLSAWRRNEG